MSHCVFAAWNRVCGDRVGKGVRERLAGHLAIRRRGRWGWDLIVEARR